MIDLAPILAHGVGGRSDLPVPLWMALYGGGGAVVVSFVALGALWLTPRLDGGNGGRPLPLPLRRVIDAPATRAVLRGIGFTAWLATVLVAAFGPASSANNPVPTWLYVWLWVGLVPASLLLGPVWRALNPLRAITALLARLSGDPDDSAVRPLPAGLGYWPAAAGLTVFVWLELVFPRPDAPLTVLGFVLAYSFAQVVAASVYGQAWYARGDAFEVYSSLIARLAPFGRRPDGKLAVRNPLVGLAAVRTEPSMVAAIVVLLGSTAFDGLTRTAVWSDLTRGAGQVAYLALGTAGLAGGIALVALLYAGAMHLASRLTDGGPAGGELVGRFAHSLIPIAVGYAIAHYFSLLVFQGQAGYILASDPFGRGHDLFGTASWAISYTAVSVTAIALVQVAAIVAGHVVGVIAAHDRAVGLFTGEDKTRSQYPLLAVMVAYTVGGIALLVGA
ncbi:MAG TPA: hypothetical protein VML96_12045 [Egibacteraceae bacterium]|nr:hypothetical protein [Egibacteraceae bacterium]